MLATEQSSELDEITLVDARPAFLRAFPEPRLTRTDDARSNERVFEGEWLGRFVCVAVDFDIDPRTLLPWAEACVAEVLGEPLTADQESFLRAHYEHEALAHVETLRDTE